MKKQEYHIDEEERKIYTHVVEAYEAIEELIDKAPTDKRTSEWRSFIKEYERLVNIANELSGNKLYSKTPNL